MIDFGSAVSTVKSVSLSKDLMTATITLNTLKLGHVHEFDLTPLLAKDKETLLHKHAYYTVNAVPNARQ